MRIISISRGLFASAFFSLALLLGNLGQTTTLPLLLFSPALFRRANRFFTNIWWHFSVKGFNGIIAPRLEYVGDVIPRKENAIVIANHQSMVDIPILLQFGLMNDSLGDMKWFAKNIIKYVPGIGWGLLFLDAIFLKRNWHSDQNKIHDMFDKFSKFQIPIWLVSFPEGTRRTEEKQRKSEEFAQKIGAVVTHKVLFPRTKGFIAAINALREHVNAIYDITLVYEDGIPNIFEYIFGIKRQIKLHLKRYDIGTMPLSDQELNDWVQRRFIEKEKLL